MSVEICGLKESLPDVEMKLLPEIVEKPAKIDQEEEAASLSMPRRCHWERWIETTTELCCGPDGGEANRREKQTNRECGN